jgi:hypothetical protein
VAVLAAVVSAAVLLAGAALPEVRGDGDAGQAPAVVVAHAAPWYAVAVPCGMVAALFVWHVVAEIVRWRRERRTHRL